MNKVNVEKVIDYTKVLKDNEILQDMDKILRNENTNLKLEIERLNSTIKEVREYMALNIRVKLNEEFGETMQYKTIYEILDKENK